MIAEEKRQIILSEGAPVEVYDASDTVLFTTSSLIGKASKAAQSELALENHRQAQFIPELDIPNGVRIHNLASDEHHLAIAQMVEIYASEKIATISRLVECNALVTIEGIEETADEYGNISSSPVLKAENTHVYISSLSSELVQYKPGLHENAEYLVFMPDLDISLLDKFTVVMNNRSFDFKVEGVDYASFQGIAVVSVCTETRK